MHTRGKGNAAPSYKSNIFGREEFIITAMGNQRGDAGGRKANEINGTDVHQSDDNWLTVINECVIKQVILTDRMIVHEKMGPRLGMKDTDTKID